MTKRRRNQIREREKQSIAGELEDVVDDARDLATDLGLDPYQVKYWVVDNDEMNQLIAYGGFQSRYPHWRWGMKYDRQQKQDQYGGGKAFEIVNNDNPSHAFLQRSNSMADQKAVITHVEAHADFFKNNRWFDDDPNAAAMLDRHGEKIGNILERPEVDREEVERWIDHLLCLEDNINQFANPLELLSPAEDEDDDDREELREKIDTMGISSEVADDIFDEEWLERQREKSDDDDEEQYVDDLIAFFILHGKQYDEDAERAVDYETWQLEILEIILRESHYFAPQKMTKVMNEGWAAFWESTMMTDELFAGDNEILEYSDHMAKVLGAPGFNPYALGMELWEYIENKTNRTEVVEHLLRVDGITARNFHDKLDFDEVLRLLDKRDSDTLAERHYSLTKPKNQGFLKQITREQLDDIWRYLFDIDRYDTIEEAIEHVDYEAGWNRMFEVRESHNDVTFLDEFLTPEFIREEEYFTYEFNKNTEQMEVASKDPEDVKKKLLLQFNNFGKPQITPVDANYKNSGELLLHHNYNGIMLDMEQAEKVLQRIFQLWGRPVNLKTIVKNKDAEEEGRMVYYDGEDLTLEELDWEEVEDIAADDIDYDTKPEEWKN